MHLSNFPLSKFIVKLHQIDEVFLSKAGLINMKRKILVTTLIGATLVFGTGVGAYAATPYASTTLKSQLKYMAEEEKLARDVYTVLAQSSSIARFSNIARSEQVHLDQISSVLQTYGIWNPTLTRAPGVFYDKNLAALYTQLIAQGTRSAADANAVGILVENTDLADLGKIVTTSAQSDVRTALSILTSGSRNHLAAFSRF